MYIPSSEQLSVKHFNEGFKHEVLKAGVEGVEAMRRGVQKYSENLVE